MLPQLRRLVQEARLRVGYEDDFENADWTDAPPPPEARTDADQLRAILSGGVIATLLGYLSLRAAVPCISPPFALLEPKGVVNPITVPLAYWLLITLVISMFHLVFLAIGYAAKGIRDGWVSRRILRITDGIFLAFVFATLVLGGLVAYEYIRYWGESNGLSGKFIRSVVAYCHQNLNETSTTPAAG